MALRWTSTGAVRSVTSTGVAEMLEGQEMQSTPSCPAPAPVPPLKNRTLANGRPSASVPARFMIQSGLPGAALTFSGSASASAPKTRTGT